MCPARRFDTPLLIGVAVLFLATTATVASVATVTGAHPIRLNACRSEACRASLTGRAAVALQSVLNVDEWSKRRDALKKLSHEEAIDMLAYMEAAIADYGNELLVDKIVRGDTVTEDRDRLATATLALAIVYCVIFILFACFRCATTLFYTNKD